jgi:hypothetical protein
LVVVGHNDAPWLSQLRPAETDQLRQIHRVVDWGSMRRIIHNPFTDSPDNQSPPKTALVVYDVQSESDLEGALEISASYSAGTELVIFAKNLDCHRRLLSASLPAGCYLPAWSKNRAEILNRLMMQSAVDLLLVMAANSWTQPNLIPLVVGNPKVKRPQLSGSTSWKGGQTQPVIYGSDSELLNPLLFALNPKDIDTPLFDPRLDRDWTVMILRASLALAVLSIPVITQNNFWSYVPDDNRSLPQINYFALVRCLCRQMPPKHVFRLVWNQRWPLDQSISTWRRRWLALAGYLLRTNNLYPTG